MKLSEKEAEQVRQRCEQYQASMVIEGLCIPSEGRADLDDIDE